MIAESSTDDIDATGASQIPCVTTMNEFPFVPVISTFHIAWQATMKIDCFLLAKRKNKYNGSNQTFATVRSESTQIFIQSTSEWLLILHRILASFANFSCSDDIIVVVSTEMPKWSVDESTMFWSHSNCAKVTTVQRLEQNWFWMNSNFNGWREMRNF